MPAANASMYGRLQISAATTVELLVTGDLHLKIEGLATHGILAGHFTNFHFQLVSVGVGKVNGFRAFGLRPWVRSGYRGFTVVAQKASFSSG